MPQQTIEIVAKDKTRAALGNVEKRLKRIDKTAANTTKSFGGMGGKIAALGAALGTALGVKSIISVNARFQDLRTTLASVTGGVQQGGEAFKFIEKFATKTQFSVEDLTTTYIKLQTAGLQPTEKLLTTFTDAAAVTTDQLGSLQAITDLFSRTTQGGLGLEEINRLTDRGIPALEILNDKLGLSRMEISEFGKTAEGARIITDALAEGINEQFGGATQNRLANLSTRMSNLNIAMDSFKDKVGTEMNQPLGEFLEKITNGIVNSDELARTIGNVLGSAVSGISVLFDHAAQNADKLTIAFGVLIGFAGAAGLSKALGTAKKAVIALSVAMRMNPIGLMVTAVAALIGALAFENGLGKTLAQVKAAVDVLGRAFGTFTQFIRDKVANIMNKLKEVFLGVVEGAISLHNTIADLSFGAMDRFEGTAEDLTGVIVDLGKEGLEYAAGAADDLKNAIVDAIPEEVIDVANELTDAIANAGAAYEEGQKEAEKFLRVQKNLDNALAGPIVTGGGVTLAGKGDSQAQVAEMERKIAAEKAIETEKAKAKQIFDALKSRINSTIDALKTERETEVDLHNQRIGDIREFFKGSLHEQRRGQELARKEQLRHEKAMAQIRKSQTTAQVDIFKSGQFAQLDLSEMTNDQLVDFTKQAGMDVLNSMAQQNKKAFQLQKALNISMAIMNTAKGVTNALGSVPFPFNLAVAGLIGAAGAVQIGAIASQQYSGRRFGGPVSNNDSYIVGENGPELFTPGATGRITANEGMISGGQTINFNITATDAKSVDELIVQRKPMIVNMIRQATQERGNRPNF
jgi:hypothetical protein